MPRFDGTGPMGTGPMTGRGMGPCNYRFSRNGGWFGIYRNKYNLPFNEPATLDDQKKLLEEELKAVKDELEVIEQEIKKNK